MQAIPIIAGMALSAGGTIATQVLAGKPKVAAAAPLPNPNVAQDRANKDDSLRMRRGTGANVLAGPGGAEPMRAGTNVLLGQ